MRHAESGCVESTKWQTAPPGKRIGRAGAVISGGEGTAQSKTAALREAGIKVCDSPATIGETVAKIL